MKKLIFFEKIQAFYIFNSLKYLLENYLKTIESLYEKCKTKSLKLSTITSRTKKARVIANTIIGNYTALKDSYFFFL